MLEEILNGFAKRPLLWYTIHTADGLAFRRARRTPVGEAGA